MVIFRNTSHKLLHQVASNMVRMVVYTEGIKYMNFMEICPVVIEIQGVENSKLMVPVNNTLVCHTAFLAADIRPCVLMLGY